MPRPEVFSERKSSSMITIGKRNFRLADMRCIPELGFEPVSADIAALAGRLSEPMHGDPADRVIVATASALGAPLITADQRLRSLESITTIW
jgi:PIN domain nuclease of toxin-antitoxin system